MASAARQRWLSVSGLYFQAAPAPELCIFVLRVWPRHSMRRDSWVLCHGCADRYL